MENFVKITTTLDKYDIVNDNIICYLIVELSYIYQGEDSISTLTKSVQIAIDKSENFKVVDWYEDDPSSFDSQLRGYGLDLYDKKNLLENQQLDKLLENMNL